MKTFKPNPEMIKFRDWIQQSKIYHEIKRNMVTNTSASNGALSGGKPQYHGGLTEKTKKRIIKHALFIIITYICMSYLSGMPLKQAYLRYTQDDFCNSTSNNSYFHVLSNYLMGTSQHVPEVCTWPELHDIWKEIRNFLLHNFLHICEHISDLVKFKRKIESVVKELNSLYEFYKRHVKSHIKGGRSRIECTDSHRNSTNLRLVYS